MITIFNRKELLLTQDMEECARARDILAENGIEYDYKVANLEGRMGGNEVGLFGFGHDHLFVYKIYVKEKDLDEAVYLINKGYE